MRIALVYDAIFPYVKGGGERIFAELAQRLTPEHEVHVFGMKFWKGPATRRTKENLWLHGFCPALPIYRKGRRSVLQALWLTAWMPFSLLRHGPFDVIHCMSIPYFPVFLLRPFCRLTGARFVTTWLEFWHGHWQTYLNHGSAMAERIEWLAARASKTIVTISQHTTDGLVEAGVPNERITLIPPGIDWEALQAQEPDEAPVDLLFAGRLIRDKRVDLALQAVARVASIRPDIRCCIVGDGPERPQLEAMADDLGIRSNVRFLGFLDDSRDLYRLMRASKTFLFPSQREGFGIVVVEAAACGLPVIAIDAPNNAAAQLVRSGGFGFVCSADPNAIAEKVDILLSDHALRARLAAKGQEWSRQYDWQTVVEKQRALYERLCAGKRRSAR